MKDRLAKGAMWVAGARVLVNVIGFVSTILLARLLLPSDFGIVAIATTVSVLLSTITDLSVSTALIQHRDPQEHHFDSAWTLNVLRATLLSIVVALIAGPLARFYNEPALQNILYVIAAGNFVTGFSNPKMVIFSRKLVFWQIFATEVSSKLVGFIVCISIAFIYKSYWAIVFGSMSSQITLFLLSYIFIRYRPKFSVSGARELLSFSIWLSLGQVVNAANYKFDSLFLGYFLGSSSLGFYTYGNNLASLPTRETIDPIARTLFPGFSRLDSDPARLRGAYKRAQALMTLIALPIGCGFALVARPFVTLVIGDKWLPAVFVIQALASVFALQTLASAALPLAMAMGRTNLMFRRNIVNFCLRMPLVIFGALYAGLNGLVYARVVAGLMIMVVNMALVRKLIDLGFRRQIVSNGRPLLGVGVMAVVLIALQRPEVSARLGVSPAMGLAMLILSGGVVYAATVLGLWFMAGRPAGPETELLEFATKASTRLRKAG
jgi:PST family polysaccharide transporter